MSSQDKFSESRGWALKWVFPDETTRTAVEQRTPSHVGEKFTEPRGWALKWNGVALPVADAPATHQPNERG